MQEKWNSKTNQDQQSLMGIIDVFLSWIFISIIRWSRLKYRPTECHQTVALDLDIKESKSS